MKTLAQAKKPESEIVAKHFADTGEKKRRKLGDCFPQFLAFNFQEKRVQEISRKILDKFHEP